MDYFFHHYLEHTHSYPQKLYQPLSKNCPAQHLSGPANINGNKPEDEVSSINLTIETRVPRLKSF